MSKPSAKDSDVFPTIEGFLGQIKRYSQLVLSRWEERAEYRSSKILINGDGSGEIVFTYRIDVGTPYKDEWTSDYTTSHDFKNLEELKEMIKKEFAHAAFP